MKPPVSTSGIETGIILSEYPQILSFLFLHDAHSYSIKETTIRIFPATATKEHMLDRLREMTGARDTVTFGSEKGHCDVFIENADRDLVVKELKRRFEPVSLKGWRNVFNWR